MKQQYHFVGKSNYEATTQKYRGFAFRGIPCEPAALLVGNLQAVLSVQNRIVTLSSMKAGSLELIVKFYEDIGLIYIDKSGSFKFNNTGDVDLTTQKTTANITLISKNLGVFTSSVQKVDSDDFTAKQSRVTLTAVFDIDFWQQSDLFLIR